MTTKFLLVVACLFSFFALAAQKKYPLSKIKEIGKSSPDTFLVKGIVKEIYKCPPCPPGAQCKPCIGDHIQIVDSKGQTDFVRLFTDEPSFYIIGEKYLFTVRIRNRYHPSDFLQLLYSERPGKKR